MKSRLLFIACIVAILACEEPPVKMLTTSQNSQTESLLQAISILDAQNVWVSGHKGTYAHTSDGGTTWVSSVMPNADTLQFRDLHAFSNEEVVLMSAGPGKLSQIRKTTNGGQNWEVTYLMEDSTGFLNTIEFWDDRRGLAFGDAINGSLFILKTDDGGNSWSRVDPDKLPPALGSEGGFAASGTCIATGRDGKAWIGTGAGDRPRVLYTQDYGDTWQSISTPIVSGEAAGIASINFWDDQNGFVAGGDLAITDQYTRNVAFTINGGTIWSLAEHPIMKGAIYGTGLVTFREMPHVFVSGPKGINYSDDYGTSWDSLSTDNYWAIDFVTDSDDKAVGWATGTDGKILQILLK
ncbi:MAG: hypothetical protein AAFO69_12540 [Bacteroidota bacterium]